MENKDKEKKENNDEKKEMKEKKQFTPEDLLEFIEEIKEKYDIDEGKHQNHQNRTPQAEPKTDRPLPLVCLSSRFCFDHRFERVFGICSL